MLRTGRLLAIALALLPAGFAAPALADVVVVKVSGPIAGQLRVGARVPAGKVVKLGARDKVTVLDAKGTREFVGPKSTRLDARQTQAGVVKAVWAQRGMRPRVAATRGAADAEAERLAGLTSSASELAEKGDFAGARAALAAIGPENYSHAVTCRMVENLRLFITIAEGGGAAAADACAELPVPGNMAALMAELDAEKAALDEALGLLAQ